MKLSFHGATRNVTGSCHMVECDGVRILIDCGLYQGGREIYEENRQDFGFDPAKIDFLLLTHAHLDHCGRIPLLIKQGFRGEIITTAASRELARLVMLDAAHLQEEEAAWLTRRATRRGREQTYTPLYTTLDALSAVDFFGRTPNYKAPIKLSKRLTATFHDAGHILGSASVLLQHRKKKDTRRVLFSGDIGASKRELLPDPEPPGSIDAVIMETTYGDRKHKALRPSVDEMYAAIRDTFDRGGNVIIPAFAVERSQELLYYLREGVTKGELPSSMQVFLDSPMAISATEIFRKHPDCYNGTIAKMFKHNKDPFTLPGLHFTRESAQSMAINRISSGAVIIAGAGMCTGGRIRHHLKHNLGRKNNSIVFVGYAARGTLGRRIIDGAKQVQIFGEDIKVRASIYTIGGFSAHADKNELLAWWKAIGSPETTILVHGDEKAMKTFGSRLKQTQVVMPNLHDEVAV
ncbi:MAG: MBL fold metallo-hydrolase [Gammaproteobacteria bacterium]|nr:MBL fold metallo-hydrolase [Gammaproteobacteria bacterium]